MTQSERACSASSTVGRKSGELAAACTAASAFITSAAQPSASVRTCDKLASGCRIQKGQGCTSSVRLPSNRSGA